MGRHRKDTFDESEYMRKGMTLRQYLDMLDNPPEDEPSMMEESIKGEKTLVNHVRRNGKAYQLLFASDKTYSGQSVYFRRQKKGEKFRPIAEGCHIPEDYFLIVAEAFSRHGVGGAKYILGVE